MKIICLLVVLATPAWAMAKTCGGTVSCACGDTVQGSATLTTDLTDCTLGLQIKSSSTLDCAGHSVTAKVGAKYGIVVQGTGSTVHGCTVSGFWSGIRIRGGGTNMITDNKAIANTHYGMELASATTNNQIVSNTILNNGDEGIHMGTAANSNLVADNDITDSRRENLYLLFVNGSTIRGNRISGAGSAGMYIKESSQNTFTDNEVSNRPIQVRGKAEANMFVDNNLTGVGFIFQAYKDPAVGWRGPHANQVNGGSVLNVKTCFRFEGATDNKATGVLVNGCQLMSQKALGGIASTGNAVVDVKREAK